MQKAISILILQSPTLHLVITFKYFSRNFQIDLCHDFSFWRAETGRCIPKKMFDEVSYTFPPLCNRTEFDCMDGDYESFIQYCPHRDESCESYAPQEDYFFCNDSKTCIPKGEFI